MKISRLIFINENLRFQNENRNDEEGVLKTFSLISWLETTGPIHRKRSFVDKDDDLYLQLYPILNRRFQRSFHSVTTSYLSPDPPALHYCRWETLFRFWLIGLICLKQNVSWCLSFNVAINRVN